MRNYGRRRSVDSWELIRQKQCDKVLVLGHRGSPLRERENTIPSFLRALEEGADGVELDVRVTKDKVLVVSHDNSLKRVFGLDMKIEESTFQEIRDKAPEIPTLAEVFSALGPVWYDIEIKADKPLGFPEEVVTLLSEELERRKEFQNRILLSSFNPFAMRKIGKLTANRFPMGIIYSGKGSSVPVFCRRGQGRFAFRCSFLKPKYDIAERERRNKKKWPLCPWTVDSSDEVRRMVALNVPIIITNDPEKVIRTLQEDRRR